MIAEFISYLRDGLQLCEKTCMEYRKDLTDIARWASVKGLRWSTITTADLMSYQCEHSHLKGATINHRMTALRSFYRWLQQTGHDVTDPAQDLKPVRSFVNKDKAIDYTRADEYLAAPTHRPDERIAKLLWAFLLETGCRLGEAMGLDYSDFDRQHRAVIVDGKGRKRRVVYYGQRTADQLESMGERTEGTVFGQYGERQLRQLFYKYFGGRFHGVHPHQLRRTFATVMHESGCAMVDLASILGHSSVRTTERYLSLSDEWRERQYRQYAP